MNSMNRYRNLHILMNSMKHHENIHIENRGLTCRSRGTRQRTAAPLSFIFEVSGELI
jgi:hypothetical protein